MPTAVRFVEDIDVQGPVRMRRAIPSVAEADSSSLARHRMTNESREFTLPQVILAILP